MSIQPAAGTPAAAQPGQRPDMRPEDQTAPAVNVVTVRENGPLAVRAPVTIDGNPVGFNVKLCRCGGSHTKPFCDGSHRTNGFVAAGEVAPVEFTPLAEHGGPLEVRPTPNGPLHLIGNVEIVTHSGKTICCMTEVWLCRCGHSGHKPFCDGTHKKIGFRSDE